MVDEDEDEDELEYTHPLDDFYMEMDTESCGTTDTDQFSNTEQVECGEETLTSDSGDPPMGIMDDDSSSDFWRARPKKMEEQEQAVRGNSTDGGRMAVSTHDGEKPSLTVGKRSGGLKSATSAATTTAPRPQAVPRPAPKKPVVSPSHIDFNVS